MGYSFNTHQTTKKEFIQQLVRKEDDKNYTREVIAYQCVGNQLWSVIEYTDKINNEISKWIALDLISSSNKCFGNKVLTENCGPSYYNCPLKFLEMVPNVTTQWSKEWREKVIAFHNPKVLEIGKTYNLRSTVNLFGINNLKAKIIEQLNKKNYYCALYTMGGSFVTKAQVKYDYFLED